MKLATDKISIEYDDKTDKVLIEGVEFEGKWFRVLKLLGPEMAGTKTLYEYRIVQQKDGKLTIKKVPGSDRKIPAISPKAKEGKGGEG